MTLQQLFQRYHSDVHPLFWPVLWLSLALYLRRKAELYRQGCQGLIFHVEWWGRVSITYAIFPHAPAGWKDDLYAASGAYGAPPRPCRSLIRDALPCAPASAIAAAGPPCPLGAVCRVAGPVRAVGATPSPCRQRSALLPRPHT